MKALLDVNILLACGWQKHEFHAECISWFDSLESYALCPITELGFLRISMSPAFGASFSDAMTVVKWFSESPRAHYIDCAQSVSPMSEVTSYKDTTDAYLVYLASSHNNRLATLDVRLTKKTWACGIAFNPITNKA